MPALSRLPACAGVLLALCMLVPPALSQGMGRFGRGAPGGMAGSGGERPVGGRGGLMRPEPTGLDAAFPAGVRCPAIASPFGSPTRHDGSPRPEREFGGHHGGIDISLPEGTPVLAIASGTVAALGAGGPLEGNYLWLRLAPEDTGLPHWVYVKYQHLRELPPLHPGDRVAAAQEIALSGHTGTTGGHFGAAGYDHLHLGVAFSRDGAAEVGGRGEAVGVRLVDPLVFYAQATAAAVHSHVVPVPYVGADGQVHPAGARVVWPVACAAD